MSNYSSVIIMLVFSVKYRTGLVGKDWREQLYGVFGNILNRNNCHPLAMGGMPDHVHILFSMGADAPAIKDLIREIKSLSSKWINEHRLCNGTFAWQSGSGRFSYSYHDLPQIVNYVVNQQTHHARIPFREELEALLNKRNVSYDPQYLPQDPA